MKRLIFLLSLLFVTAIGYTQSKYFIRADSVYIQYAGGNGELILMNAGRDTEKGGVLYNTGGGRTAFRKSTVINDSTIVIGGDTLEILGGAKGGSALDTTSMSLRIDARVKYSDTLLMLYPYLRKNDTVSLSFRIEDRVKYSDTAAMLSIYLRKSDTASISNRIDQRMKYSDTTSLSNRIDSKQPAGNYITGLNGDGSATGPGLSNFVLSPTSVTPGTYKLATVTFDQKGRGTFAANGVVEQLSDSAFRINNDTITISGTGESLQQVTVRGNKTTDTVIAGGLRTKNIIGDTLSEPDFEIDLVPDIQNMTQYYPTSILYPMFQFWRDSSAAYNIKAVIQLGDLTNDGQSGQFTVADSAVKNIDIAGIPYMAVIGNHDYNTGNSTPLIRNASNFNTYFGPSRYAGKPWYGSNYLGSNENFYIKFDVGSHKFLVLGLEFLPRDSALNWAQSVLDSFPERETIIATHAYRTFFGEKSVDTSLFSTTYYSLTNDNNGQGIWDKLLKRNKQIIMVANGHYIYPSGSSAMRNRMTEAGLNGNVVYQIMTNYQNDANGGNGYFTRLKFKPSIGKVEVSTYSSTLKVEDSRFPAYSLDYPAINMQSSIGISALNGSLNVAGETHLDSTLYLHSLSRERLLITRQNGKVDTVTNQAANTFLAGPISGSAANPSFRLLTPTDIPINVNEGITKNNDTIQLGQSVGAVGDPGKLTSNREIPLNGFDILFNGNGNFGIGATPSNKLDVRGALGVQNGILPGYNALLSGGFPASAYVVQGSGNWGFSMQRATADGGSPLITFYKSRNSDPLIRGSVVAGDGLGAISYQPVSGDNTTIQSCAGQEVFADSVASGYIAAYIRWLTRNRAGSYVERLRLTSSGNLGIGSTSPVRKLEVAGAAYITDTLILPNIAAKTDASTYSTIIVDGSGNTFKRTNIEASGSLDFPSTSAGTSSDLTITVTGAIVGDLVVLGIDNASMAANSSFTAWVSAADIVTVRFNNYSSGPIDPASGTFKARILK